MVKAVRLSWGMVINPSVFLYRHYKDSMDDHSPSHMLHVWYIYLQNWVIYGANVGRYSSTMEHMGIYLVNIPEANLL
jgi:hypothetical protein